LFPAAGEANFVLFLTPALFFNLSFDFGQLPYRYIPDYIANDFCPADRPSRGISSAGASSPYCASVWRITPCNRYSINAINTQGKWDMKIIKWIVIALAALGSPLAFAAELHLYAGAGLRVPVDQIVARYEKESGNTVIVEYGGSGQILTRYQLTQQGDLFLPVRPITSKTPAAGKVAAAFPRAPHPGNGRA
jgi:hypothetical protein